jgi:hypothetical protein
MIIQKVIKGISGAIPGDEAEQYLRTGIRCTWWHNVDPLPDQEIVQRLNERNLTWHQNHYDKLDPLESNRPFYEKTPFISTTAGTVDRDAMRQRNTMLPAWLEALYFATDSFQRDDGYLYYCYVFVLGKKSIGHRGFAEEVRELNVYTNFSPFQPEGEVTAKIIIPPTQIERVEYWSLKSLIQQLMKGNRPQPAKPARINPLYLPPEDYSNVRELIS